MPDPASYHRLVCYSKYERDRWERLLAREEEEERLRMVSAEPAEAPRDAEPEPEPERERELTRV